MSTAPEIDRFAPWFAAQGIPGQHWQELLHYNQAWFRPHLPSSEPQLPLPDDPCVAAWQRYAREAERQPWPGILQRLYPGFRFPVRSGISQTQAYRRALQHGSEADDTPLRFENPDGIQLELIATAIGRLPALTLPDRRDFESVLRVLLHRNEPVPIPASMGAAWISGLPNRDRIDQLKAAYLASHPTARAGSWRREWERLRTQDKAEFQDRLLLLSVGPYSGVSAERAGFANASWLQHSRTIRIHHECTHAFCKRIFGHMHINLLDELMADFIGMRAALGRFDARLFLQGMGVSVDGELEREGRMRNYLSQPALPEALWPSQARILCSAAQTLEQWQQDLSETADHLHTEASAIFAIANTSLLELAIGSFPVSPYPDFQSI